MVFLHSAGGLASVISAHSLPPLLASGAHSIGFRTVVCQVKSSLYINYRQPYGSLSNVLRKPAVEDGSGRKWRRGSMMR
jgi:hypothetical protein